MVAIPTLGRIPYLLDEQGLANELQAASVPTRAGVPGRAWNMEQQTLSGAQVLNGTLCFLVNMGMWASKRLSGAGLLQRTNNQGKDKQQNLFPERCDGPSPKAAATLGGRLVRPLIDRREHGGSETCLMSHAAQLQY